MKYNVLVYGSGGREHALAWKISQSPLLDKLFLALPNDGFKSLGKEISFSDFEDLAKKCVENGVNLAVIGPEDPLSKGIVDVFNKYGIKCIGANQKWARLESSKKFAKEFMIKHKLPTAKYFVVDSKKQIDDVLAKFKTPPVLKADGLAAGKGVHLSVDMKDAKKTLNEFLDGKYGEASSSIVVEELLMGEELSVIAIFDGKTLAPLASARDYKRLKDGQVGPNTGGMGAYCPVKISKEQEADLAKYMKNLENALKADKADFSGIIYSGLMLTSEGIKVLEYNMRFGDPETQPLMVHLDSDILEIFANAADKKLAQAKINWKKGTSIGVVVAANGYPENPKKGCEIKMPKSEDLKGAQIFYAGVKLQGKKMLSNGGRVLLVCKTGEDIKKVRKEIYKTIDEIDFNDKVFRTDIGL